MTQSKRFSRVPWFPLLCIFGILTFAGYVRFAGLGEPDFHEDELDHYYAALSLDRGDPPLLPSGNEYTRGVDYTRMVGASLSLTERPETAARIPSAVFGMVAVVIAAAFAWVIAGPWASVSAALLMAIYPDAVAESHRVRFYTYQLVLLLSAMWVSWYAVRPLAPGSTPERREMRGRWLAALTALPLFALPARAQVTTLSVIAGLMSFCAVVAIFDLRGHGREALKFSLPLQAIVGGVVLGTLLLIWDPMLVSEGWAQALPIIDSIGLSEDAVVGTSYPLPGLH